MKHKLLYSSIILMIVGFIGRLYADQYTYITPDNILHDSFWLPLGTFLFLIGFLLLLVWFLSFLIRTVRRGLQT